MKKFLCILPLLIVGLLFYLLDSENEFINDDLYYSLSHPDFKPIDSVAALFSSQYYDYFHTNGRFLVHLIVQLFCGVIGVKTFHVLNTIIFIIFLYGLRYYTNNHVRKDIPITVILVFLIILVPAWHITYLGYIAGAVNYLWAGCAYIWWINLFENNKDSDNSTLKNCGLLMASFLVGTLQESFCIGIAGYLFLSILINRKSVTRSNWIMSIAFMVGAAICVLAPANFTRLSASMGSLTGIIKYMSSIAKLIVYAKTFILLCCVLVTLYIRKSSKDFVIKLLKSHSLLLTAVSFNALFVAVIAYTGPHQLTCIESYSMLILLCTIYSLYAERFARYFKYMDKVALLAFILFALVLYPERKSIADAYKQLWHATLESTDGTVVATRYFDEITRKRGWLRGNFVRGQEPFNSYNRTFLSLHLTKGASDDLVKTLLPLDKEAIIAECKHEEDSTYNVIRLKKANALVIKSKENLSNKCVDVFITPTFFGKLRNLIISGQEWNKTPMEVNDLDWFKHDNDYYYIIMNDLNFYIEEIQIPT